MFQTNLIVTFKGGETEKFFDIHPDIQLEIQDGMLTFENTTGSGIWYIPATNILYFETTCEKVGA
jgi:hypothetical protein